LFAAFADTGFVEECGVVGELVLDEFRTARLQVLPFLEWRRATCPTAPFDATTLARFRASDPHPYTPPTRRDISL